MDICAFYLEFYCGIIEKTILRQIPVILLDFYLCVLGLKQSRVNTCQGLYSMLRYQGSRGHNHVRRFWDTNTGVKQHTNVVTGNPCCKHYKETI